MANGYHKTIAVFSPDNYYLSNCSWKRALTLLKANKAVRVNATTIRLKQSKQDRIRIKHNIIAEAKRICYICNRKIPEDEIATIDHVIPRSRDAKADIPNNMRCCCEKCNNDKGNMTISEYVEHIKHNRNKYQYISDNRLLYLENFSKYYEDEYKNNFIMTKKKQQFNNYKKSWKRGKR